MKKTLMIIRLDNDTIIVSLDLFLSLFKDQNVSEDTLHSSKKNKERPSRPPFVFSSLPFMSIHRDTLVVVAIIPVRFRYVYISLVFSFHLSNLAWLLFALSYKV